MIHTKVMYTLLGVVSIHFSFINYSFAVKMYKLVKLLTYYFK
jgi:hypothetical protein